MQPNFGGCFAQISSLQSTGRNGWAKRRCPPHLIQLARNIDAHIAASRIDDLFQISANTEPNGARSRSPTDQNPDMLLRVVRDTDAGNIARGAKFETGTPYADLAYTKLDSPIAATTSPKAMPWDLSVI